jgi:hypothetical protein
MNVQVVPRISGICQKVIGTLGGYSLKGKTTILRIVNLGSIPGISTLYIGLVYMIDSYTINIHMHNTNFHTWKFEKLNW